MKKKRILLLIGAVAVVAVAAVNVNVSFVRGKSPNVSLGQVRALAYGENPPPYVDYCAISATTLLNLSSYKMALTNTNLTGGVAIRNNPSAGAVAYGLDVEQAVRDSRSSVAVRAHALAATETFGSQAYGVYAVAGNAANSYGVYAGLKGCGYGAALYATDDVDYSPHVNSRYAAYFRGSTYASSMNIGGTGYHTLHVSGNIGITGSLYTISDKRHKANIKKLGGALEIVTKLRPVTYNLKQEDLSKYRELVPDSLSSADDNQLRKRFGLGKKRNTNKKHVGFVAQELEEVFPELVHSDIEGTLSVDYVSLVPVLAGAIQEQSKTIEGQNKTIKKQSKVIDKQNEIIDEMHEAIELLSRRLEALEGVNEQAAIGNGQTAAAGGEDKVELGNFSFSMFPNPASSGAMVTVEYTMHVDAPVAIELYNSMGKMVRLLLPKQHQPVGTYSVQTSVAGLLVGPYVVRVTSGKEVESKHLLVN
jgi:uncharacterized coiled-coil protein SlyX